MSEVAKAGEPATLGQKIGKWWRIGRTDQPLICSSSDWFTGEEGGNAQPRCAEASYSCLPVRFFAGLALSLFEIMRAEGVRPLGVLVMVVAGAAWLLDEFVLRR